MDNSTINTISLCSGVGMLDEGFHAGLRHMGIRSRTIMYAEREAYPVSVLEARMEEGSIHPAPIWFGDFTELPARQFRGVVDCVAAGFPCQDLSVAGRRDGLNGKRSGLFFEVVRIANDCGARFMFLENVAGIATATSTVMDKAVAAEITGERYRPRGDELGESDEAVLERAAARVVGELADLGWDAEWITISASDVGASHGRARWFCLAWRMADASGEQADRIGRAEKSGRDRLEWMREAAQFDYRQTGNDCADGLSEALGHSESIGTGSRSVPIGSEQKQPIVAATSAQLAYSEHTTSIERFESAMQRGRTREAEQAGMGGSGIREGTMADTDGIGLRAESDREQQPIRIDKGEFGLFAPGPASPAWQRIISASPWLSPALEPTFCELVNGLAFDMDDCRAQRLKCSGNGVVPAQAAIATIVLARRAGIFLG